MPVEAAAAARLEVDVHPVGAALEHLVPDVDEEVVLVPFDNLRDAYRLLIDLGKRGVGLSLAVLFGRTCRRLCTRTRLRCR